MPTGIPPQSRSKTSKRIARRPLPPSEAATPAVTDGLTASTLERLIEGAECKQHPFGKVWCQLAPESLTELAADIRSRGLDQAVVLYQGMVLDGWHRYLACLHSNTKPAFVTFEGTDLEAAEKVNASGIRRHSTQEQRYAAFTLLCDACDAFKAKYEQLKAAATEQQQSGKPLSTGGQRVDVLKAKAAASGVSKTTAAKVERVKKMKPKAVAQIAAGKTTVNKELKKLTGGNAGGRTRPVKPKQTEPDKGRASAPAASPPGADVAVGPLLADLIKIGSKLADVLKNLDHVKWATEDQAKWDEAVLAIHGAATHLSEKTVAGFKGVDQTELRAVNGEQKPNENESQVSVAAV